MRNSSTQRINTQLISPKKSSQNIVAIGGVKEGTHASHSAKDDNEADEVVVDSADKKVTSALAQVKSYNNL